MERVKGSLFDEVKTLGLERAAFDVHEVPAGVTLRHATGRRLEKADFKDAAKLGGVAFESSRITARPADLKDLPRKSVPGRANGRSPNVSPRFRLRCHS